MLRRREARRTVRDFSVILDSELFMAPNIEKLSSIYFVHLRQLRDFRLALNCSSLQRLISVFIMLRVDYCNAVTAGLSASTLDPLMVGTAAGNHTGYDVQSLH